MVDNTLALQVRPFQMPDIGQIYGQAQNIQMNRMRMAEAQETAQERNALRGLLSSGIDPYSAEGLAQVRRTAPMLASQFEQAAGQRAVQQAQVRRYNAQADADRFKLYRGQLGGVNSQDAWTNWRSSVVQEFPQFAASIPERFSPQAREEVAGGADLLIQRATAAAAAARPDEFTRALAAAGYRPGTPEYEAARRARVVSLTGGRQPRLQSSVVEGRPIVTDLDTGEFFFAREVPEPTQRTGAVPTAPVDLRRPQAAAPTAPAQPTNMMLPNVAAPTLAAGPSAVPPAAAAPTTLEGAAAARDVREVRTAGQRVGAEEAARIGARSAATQQQEAQQLDRGIEELRRISAPGGLLERSTGSGVGRLVDIAGEFVGISSRSAQAAAALAPVADIVLKLVPRFEGPQSDRDTRSYQEAAGRLADPTIPNETRLAAAREIIRLMETRRNQFQFGEGAAPPTGAAQPARTGQSQLPRTFEEGQTATGPNGQRIQFLNGQWVPMR